MKYNIIGDIHGRNIWRKLVRPDAVNIFLGDYLDPYPCEGEEIISEEWENLHEIMRFKREHPETVLLLGNHDLHYLWPEHYSRYNSMCDMMYNMYVVEHLSDFQLAYAIGEQALVTHAGVTEDWLKLAGMEHLKTPQAIADGLNNMLSSDMQLQKLTTRFCFDAGDYIGTSSKASPVWVRPETLLQHNALPECIQIVGHTQMPEPMLVENVCFCDCLGFNAHSIVAESTEDGQGQLMPGLRLFSCPIEHGRNS